MTWLLAAPLLAPLLAALGVLAALRRPTLQQPIALLGPAAALVAAGALFAEVWSHGTVAGQIGGWPAPFGITLVADALSAGLLVVSGAIGFLVALFGAAEIDRDRERFGFWPAFLLLLVGVNGSFLAGDVFNLYVWFEVMLAASFVLVALGTDRVQIDAALRYTVISLVGSAFFLLGVAALYRLTGTLNLADLARQLPLVAPQDLVDAVAVLFLVAFGLKAGLVPLFFWLPASYHTPTVTTSAILAGLLTKVGVYALLRLFTLVFDGHLGFTHTTLLWAGGVTMLVGGLASLVQADLRRLLSFQLISHIGYIVVGLGLFTVAGIAGAILYLLHDMLVKTGLFLASGVTARLGGTMRLRASGGVLEMAPAFSALTFLLAFSLAGMPPLSGFWAKLALLQAAFADGYHVVAAAMLIAAGLTLLAMGLVWRECFWKEPEPDAPRDVPSVDRYHYSLLFTPVAALSAATVLLGVASEPAMRFATRAATDLLDSESYIRAVGLTP